MKNVFKELNVEEYFTEEQVKKSYYNLLKKNYDELDDNNLAIPLAKKRIDRIEEAYEIISSIKDFDYLAKKTTKKLCYFLINLLILFQFFQIAIY